MAGNEPNLEERELQVWCAAFDGTWATVVWEADGKVLGGQAYCPGSVVPYETVIAWPLGALEALAAVL